MGTLLHRLCLVVVITVSVHVPGFADQTRREIREEFLSLSAIIETRTPSYSRLDTDEGFVVFGPEGCVLSISISNFTGRPVALSRRTDWTEALSVSVSRYFGRDQSDDRRGRLRRASNQIRSQTTVEARRSVSDRFVLETDGEMEPGEYGITVQLNEDGLSDTAKQSGNILKREIKLRVVDPRSTLEQIDRLLQMSTQAMRSKQYDVVRRFAAQIISLKPDSIPARSDMGLSYLAEKNCAAAKPVLTEAIDLLQSGRDPELKISESARQELRWAIRDRLAQECP